MTIRGNDKDFSEMKQMHESCVRDISIIPLKIYRVISRDRMYDRNNDREQRRGREKL